MAQCISVLTQNHITMPIHCMYISDTIRVQCIPMCTQNCINTVILFVYTFHTIWVLFTHWVFLDWMLSRSADRYDYMNGCGGGCVVVPQHANYTLIWHPCFWYSASGWCVCLHRMIITTSTRSVTAAVVDGECRYRSTRTGASPRHLSVRRSEDSSVVSASASCSSLVRW